MGRFFENIHTKYFLIWYFETPQSWAQKSPQKGYLVVA
jgi:hypothetical protein